MIKIKTIRSGGQSGVDRASLDFAREHNIPIKYGWAEDMPNPPGLLDYYPELVETPETDVSQRTMWNVRDSDATLVFICSKSPGTILTEETAKRIGKPYFLSDYNSVKDVAKWIKSLPDNIELNIGGPRESEAPGIYNRTKDFLSKLYKLLKE